MKSDDANNLSGHLLIAMPKMEDPNFAKTVTYICEHSDQGTLGLVINQPLDINLGEVFTQLELNDCDQEVSSRPVLHGGPVYMERGFVIHDAEDRWENSTETSDSIQVTTSRDILIAMASGHGPKRATVALGYAGWGAGQLEHEILANSWLNTPASTQIIFDTPFEDRWQHAAQLLGIDLSTISSEAGHA
ncbi:MAG: YqgE/AlgH family protein [Gammaproteobacteria bacterium]|jgi:putative transcriptional regulator|nr:YqgE/AlgH family protein [Gammaproteobacteria bacterium]